MKTNMNRSVAWLLVAINIGAAALNLAILLWGLEARGFTGLIVGNAFCVVFSGAVALWIWTTQIYKG